MAGGCETDRTVYKWLKTKRGNWRDADCPCGSTFHFDGKMEDLFCWERIHLRHMASDSENHDMISFYPEDMVIFYHSNSGYVVERRRHTAAEVNEIYHASVYGHTMVAGV